MKWVTRARPKTDRIACPWLITKFIDPAGPGLLAIGLGGLDVEDDDHRLLERATFVYDALYAWCRRQAPAPA